MGHPNAGPVGCFGRKPTVEGERMIKLWIRALLWTLVSFLLVRTPPVLPANAAEVMSQGQTRSPVFVIDFSGYTGGSVDPWLRAKGFKLEKDARDRRLLELSVAKDALILEAKGRLRGVSPERLRES